MVKYFAGLVIGFGTLMPVAQAQDKIQASAVISEGQQNFVTSLQLHDEGFEFWGYHGTAGDKVELISPKLVHKGTNGKITAGFYGRFEKDQISRGGIAGSLSIGKKDGWQLTGPYYLFLQRSKGHFSDKGLWLPNLRLTHPVAPSTRLGFGLAHTMIEGQKTVDVFGLYLQQQLSKSSNLQLRAGRFMAPSTQAGKWQLLGIYTEEF